MKRIENLRIVITVCIIVNLLMVFLMSQTGPMEDKTGLWVTMSLASSVLIWAIVFIIIDGILLLAKNSEREQIEYQNKANTAQLHLLASIADKLGVPVNDINEVVEDFGIEFE